MAGASLIPEYYKEKILVSILLAPASSMMHNTNKLFAFIAQPTVRKAVEELLEKHGWYNLLPYDYLDTEIGTVMCDLFDGKICDYILSFFADEDPSIDYTERYEVYLSFIPSGASWRCLAHYAQLMVTKTEAFQRFDYESASANMAKYGKPSPPDYNMTAIDLPIALFSGSVDELADPKDVAWTYE